MPIESSFMNLNRGNRLSAYMGLDLAPGVELQFTAGYTFADVPVLSITKDGEPVTTALRNQHVYIVPACYIDPKGDYKVLVEPNPALSAFGSVQSMYYIQPGTGRQLPGFYITLRRDLDLTDIKYAVRLYMQV